MAHLSSYDDLLSQVEGLKLENTHLRLELQDNSSHLTQLENEASNMKDVLTNLQRVMSVDDVDSTTYHQVGPHYVNEEPLMVRTVDQNSNDDTASIHTGVDLPCLQQQKPKDGSGSLGSSGSSGGGQKSHSSSPSESPSKRRSASGDREIYNYIQDLDRERNGILKDIESEEKHRQWYYEQIEEHQKKIDDLPYTEEYNLQTDMTRRQLEYELQRLQASMERHLGHSDQISSRHEARLQRIRMIEAEMFRLQQRHREQQQLDHEKRDSGTCDHNETERDGIVVMDAATNTSGNAEAQNHQKAYLDHTLAVAGAMPGAHGAAGPKVPGGPDLPNNHNLSMIFHGSWPINQSSGSTGESSLGRYANQETASVISFNSSNASSGSRRGVTNQQLGTKVEMVYSLLSMLGTHDKDDMSRTLLAMSSSQDSCIAMRQSGCLPLLIQLLHGSDKDSGLLGNTRGSKAARARAAAALHNIVHSHPDDKRGRREARVLRLLEQIRAHCDQLKDTDEDEDEGQKSRMTNAGTRQPDIDHHPGPAIAALMKLSFDEEHRHAICTLGGLQAIAELLQVDHEVHGNTTDQYSITMRRYACMALTNLTFGDGTNKALLCSMKAALQALVYQLESPNEDLVQVAASVLRNLSWRADLQSKRTLREVSSVIILMRAALKVKKESTLKSILSALWNLSAHCSENKADICAVEGALPFLVASLTYKSPSKTLAIIENGGGILRNVSSHIAVREDYRQCLRDHCCLQILLKHLRSPSLTIVSNACGTLWNLSARCTADQQMLWEMGAVSMLRNLVHSKHKMISMGSAAALKNLLAAKPNMTNADDNSKNKSNLPTLQIRKQRALEAELDQALTETCENIESPHSSPTETRKQREQNGPKYMYSGDTCGIYQVAESENRRPHLRAYALHQRSGSTDSSPMVNNKFGHQQRSVSRSGSQDSVGSTHSDVSYDRSERSRVKNMLAKSSKLLNERQSSTERKRDGSNLRHSGHKTHGDSDSSSDRGISSNESAPNSRIMQVMQEVAMQAGISGADKTKNQQSTAKPSWPSGPGLPHEPPVVTAYPAQFQRQQQTGTLNNMSPNMSKAEARKFPPGKHNNLSHNVNLYDGGNSQDQPINYSMKYSESSTMNNENTRQMAYVGATGFGAQKPPIPKVGNFVGSPYTQRKQNPAVNSQAYNPLLSPQVNRQNNSENKQCNTRMYSANPGYAETDLDEPTNFSLRFSEADDQPINYSTRYTEREAHFPNPNQTSRRLHPEFGEDHSPGMHDDTVIPFCTEGTPLNFLSTATSMNDLTGSKGPSRDETHEGRVLVDIPSQDEPQNFAMKYAESEHMSGSGTNTAGTGKKTSSTIVNTSSPPGVQSLPNEHHNEETPRTFSAYNDNNNPNGPPEHTRQFNLEGTPTCFSRVSSLSSLNSNDAHDLHDTSILQGPHQNHNTTLKTIQEADITVQRNLNEIPPASLPVQSNQEANTSLGADSAASAVTERSKSVTFDENQQVQETPLMFSRCSSLGSLDSFDAHSVHSSIVSEYSRRASEVVSPSDLPDSPSETMPPTPKRSESPAKFNNDGKDRSRMYTNHARSAKIPLPNLPEHADEKDETMSTVSTSRVFKDAPISFATEGTPRNFSTTSSLSALTFDDEPKIKMDPDLKANRVRNEPEQTFSQNESSDQMTQNVPQEQATAKTPEDEDDEKDHSSMSEGEEEMLMQFIKGSMPNNSRKKMRKSSSDNSIKNKPGNPKVNNLKPKNTSPNKVPTSGPSTSKPTNSRMPVLNTSQQSTQSQNQVRVGLPRSGTVPLMGPSNTLSVDFGQDTMQSFATEGTPLNYSQTGSLSDLSMMSEMIEKPNNKPDSKMPVQKDGNGNNDGANDVHSDASSVSDDAEDLLSSVIQSAMPKKASQKKCAAKQPQAVDNGANTKLNDKQNSSMKEQNKSSTVTQVHFQQQTKTVQIPSGNMNFQPQRTSSQVSQNSFSRPSINSDTVQTYMTEGTPLNFSTATSLSDLTYDDDVQGSNLQSMPLNSIGANTTGNMPSYGTNSMRADDSVFTHSQPSMSCDSPRYYGVEGTPLSFSRNDSLSSLSCDEDVDLSKEKHQMKNERVAQLQHPRGGRGIPTSRGRGIVPSRTGSRSPRRVSASGIPGPAHNAAIPQPGRFQQQNTKPAPMTTEVIRRQHYSRNSSRRSSTGDQVITYAVEGTPMCFSRNDSLSSLDSDDHEGLASHHASVPVKAAEDQKESFKVEDTPVCFSRNSSLSSLSVESLSMDPSESEQALLDQVINSAMPKKSSKSERKSSASKLPRQCPSGSSTAGKTNSTKASPMESGETSRASPSKLDAVDETKNFFATNSSDTNLKDHPTTDTESTATAWRKAPHKSCDEIQARGSEDSMSRFGFRRAHSQDSSGFTKHKIEKDHSNLVTSQTQDNDVSELAAKTKELSLEAQTVCNSTVTGEVLNLMEGSSSSGSSYQDNKELEESLQAMVKSERPGGEAAADPSYIDNKELEESFHRDFKILSDPERILERQLSEISQEDEKIDSTKSELMGETEAEASVDSYDIEITEDTDDFEVSEINNEELPEDEAKDNTLQEEEIEIVDYDYQDNRLVMGDDAHDNTLEIENPQQLYHRLDSFSSAVTTDTLTYEEEEEEEEEGEEISPEDEKALEENANLILSELSNTRNMVSSLVDEDMFIENETISLVSNDYTSDTCSEVSVSLSHSSKGGSEHASESTLSQTSSANASQRGPRILKPGEKSALAQQKQTDESKGIRGRRKPLYSSPYAKGALSSPSGKKQPPPPPPRVITAGRSSTRTPPVSTSPVTVRKGTAKSSTYSGSNIAKASPKASKIGVRSSIPKSGAGSPRPSEQPGAAAAERPKPPIKQGTFTKETKIPSASVNSEGDSKKMSPVSDKSSSPNEEKGKTRHKSGGSSPPQRTSPPDPWSKALGGFNFLVDTSAENGFEAPYKQIQAQKNAKDAPPALRRGSNGGPGNGKKGGSNSSLNKGSSSSLQKTGSGSSLNKSNSSVARASSGSIQSRGSASSLSKTSSKGSIQKSDSSSSLKKGSGSRPSTPSGRRTPVNVSGNSSGASSTASTPIKKTTVNSNANSKKPVTSKIASLWKKDGEHPRSRSASPSTRTPSANSPVDSKPPSGKQKPPPTPARKSSIPSGKTMGIPAKSTSKATAKKSSSGLSSQTASPREGLSKSSTYDKLSDETQAPSKTDIPVADPPKATGGGWRRDKIPAQGDAENSNLEPISLYNETSEGLLIDDDDDDDAIWIMRDDSKRTEKSNPDLAEASKPQSQIPTTGASKLPAAKISSKNMVPKSIPKPSQSNTSSSTSAIPDRLDPKQQEPPKNEQTSLPNGGSEVLKQEVKRSTSAPVPGSKIVTNQNGIPNRTVPPSPNASPTKLNTGAISAIVPPFNYKPKETVKNNPNPTNTNNNQSDVILKNNLNQSQNNTSSVITAPVKQTTQPMTKTEMLMARRRQSYLNSVQRGDGEGEDDNKSKCKVTTV